MKHYCSNFQVRTILFSLGIDTPATGLLEKGQDFIDFIKSWGSSFFSKYLLDRTIKLDFCNLDSFCSVG